MTMTAMETAMELETTRFGVITFNDEDVLTFTQPLLGFHAYRHFILLPGPQGSPLLWLQSIDDGQLAFLLMDPVQVVPDYATGLAAMVREELNAQDEGGVQFYTTVTAPRDGGAIRTNLKAPIAVHRGTGLALQVILDDPRYPVHYVLPNQSESAPNQQD